MVRHREDNFVNKADREAWWMELAEEDLRAYEAKRAEYGSADLDVMGAALERQGMPHGCGHECAIGFYLLGKVARLASAWAQGKEPSDDTLKDIVTYGNMMRLHREEKRRGRADQPDSGVQPVGERLSG